MSHLYEARLSSFDPKANASQPHLGRAFTDAQELRQAPRYPSCDCALRWFDDVIVIADFNRVGVAHRTSSGLGGGRSGHFAKDDQQLYPGYCKDNLDVRLARLRHVAGHGLLRGGVSSSHPVSFW